MVAVDEAEYGVKERNEVIEERNGLRAEMVMFEIKNEEKKEGIGWEWGSEEWERRAGHIRRMELIKRATAPTRLVEPRTLETFDELSTALTRNKSQLFTTKGDRN